MRRLWLILLMTFALTAGGLANALAGRDCPMESSGSMSHGCCDDEDGQGDPVKLMDGCPMGQTCRAPPTVMPVLEPVQLSMAAVAINRPTLQSAPAPNARPSEFWRPPRTV